MNYDALIAASTTKSPSVAVVGVRGFNHSLVVYGVRSKWATLRILCDRNIEACLDAYRAIGVPDDRIVHCTSVPQGLREYEAGSYLAFDDVEPAMSMPFDILVEGTGSPEASARHALLALDNGKHVVMVSKESDSVIGSLMSAKARQKGLLYSLAEGDQPALLVGLVSWARTAGLSILSIGKASEYDFVYDPAEATMRVEGTTRPVPGFDAVWRLGAGVESTLTSRSTILSEFSQRALPDLLEMGIVANHLREFQPDVPELHSPVVRTVEIPDVMCPKEMGGLLSGRGRIDAVNCLRRVDEQSMEGGVFLVVECDDEVTWRVLAEKGVPVSRNRKTALVYYPAHYLGFEVLFSVLSVGVLGLPSGSENPRPRYDLVARAQKALTAGMRLAADGPDHAMDGFEGHLIPATSIDANTHVPYFMADGARLKRDIHPGSFLTADMLEVDESSILWKLRREQDRMFFGARE